MKTEHNNGNTIARTSSIIKREGKC